MNSPVLPSAILPEPNPAAALAPTPTAAPETAPVHQPTSAKPRSFWQAVAMSIFVLAVAAGGMWFFSGTSGRETTDSAFIEGHRIALAAQAGGRVSEVLVDDNQHVEAGQMILRIDPADYQVRLEQAEAARAQAEGTLAHARAQIPVIESAARQAGAQVKVAEANARKTADDLRRYRQLSEAAVSRSALDAVATQEIVSAAQVEVARQAAVGAEAQIVLARTAIASAEAAVRAAEAQIRQAQLALSYCELRAPVSGFVTRKVVERGNTIQAGQLLLNLVTADTYVVANFKETQLSHLLPGQPAIITVDTFPGVKLKGRVESRMAGTGSAFALLPTENATGNFVKVVQRVPVKIVLDPGELARQPQLALGLSVIVTVVVSAPSSSSQL